MFRFVIACEKSPGILSKIVVTIRRSGNEIVSQEIDDSGKDRVIDIDFTATQEQAKKLYREFQGISNVYNIKAYASNKTNKPNVERGLDGNVAKIVANFPDIGEVVLAQRKQYDETEVVSQMFETGLKVATKRINSGDVVIGDQKNDLVAAIKQTLVPELRLLGEVEYVEEGFETGLMVMSSVFTKAAAKKTSGAVNTFASLESGAARCDFLSGYIMGVVNAAMDAGTYSYDVQETRCRNEGHPYCLFEFVD